MILMKYVKNYNRLLEKYRGQNDLELIISKSLDFGQIIMFVRNKATQEVLEEVSIVK